MIKDEKNHQLFDARTSRNWTQQELADKIGSTPLPINRWEQGKTRPNPYFRQKLAEAFGMTEVQLGLTTHPSTEILPQTPTLAIQSTTQSLYDTAIPLSSAITLVGREQELARIRATLCQSESNVVITALNGIPGVGKTSLAITLAHSQEMREYFSDGILWAGLGPTPNIPGLLGRWASLFGLSATQFASFDLEQKRTQIRNTIGARSMLLVLDDVWRLEDALAMRIGGPNCAYLITTRFPTIATQLAVEDTLLIPELNTEQSVQVLRQLAPQVVDHEPEKVHALAEAIGGLPLALTLLGNYLRKQSYGTARRVSTALERLTHIDERFKISEPHVLAETHPTLPGEVAISLSSIIEVSDHLLTDRARKTLYALSIFPPKPESFSEATALAVADCSIAELDELTDAGLLEYQGTDRYRLHQIISDYAHLHQNPQTDLAIALRLMIYMQQYTEAHEKEYELMEQELTLLLYTLDKTMMHEAFQPQVVPLVCTAAPFLLMRGYTREAERFLNRAYRLAQASDMARVLLLLGDVSQKRGDLSKAYGQYQEAREAAERFNDVVLIGKGIYSIGRIAWKLGDYQEAERLLQEGLTFARSTEQPELIREMCTSLAALFANSADWAQAEAYAREGLELARKTGDRREIGYLLLNLGCSLHYSLPEKRLLFEEALQLARSIKNEEQCCIVLLNLGDWYIVQKEFLQAEQYLHEAVSLSRRLGLANWTSATLSELAIALRLQGRYEEAEGCIQEALGLAKERPRFMCIALSEVGNLALAKGQRDSALEAFQEMHRLCPQGDFEIEALSLYGIARVYEQLGRFDQALSSGKSALAMLKEKNLFHYIEEVQEWFVQKLSHLCTICNNPIVESGKRGRTKRYCSDRCRKRAQRQREYDSASQLS